MHTLVTNPDSAELEAPRNRSALVLVLVIVLLVAGGLVWRELSARPISSVRIAGEFVNVSRDEMQSVINGFLPSGFFSLDVEAVRRSASRLPWVRRISVRRIWPDSLHIAVVERVAVARWNQDAYLEADGTSFVPGDTALDNSFVRLAGPAGSEQKVLQQYQRLVRIVEPLRESVRRVSLDERGAWRVELARGPVLQLGRGETLQALAPYIGSLRRILGDRYEDAMQVDLRYQNGFAVRWRTPDVAEEEQSS